MKGTIKGRRLLVSLPMLEEPRDSSTGKTELVATSRGFKKMSLKINGRSVYASLIAFVRKNVGATPKRRPDK